MNFRDFDIVSGEKLFIDNQSIKLIDTTISDIYNFENYSYYPTLTNFFYIPSRFLFIDNFIVFPKYEQDIFVIDKTYFIDRFYGAGKFGNIVAVFTKIGEQNKLFLNSGVGQQVNIVDVNLDVQLFKQINQFSFILVYNSGNNSIIALYDLTALEDINNAVPFATAVFPKSFNLVLVKEENNYVFTTDDYTVYFSLMTEPFPVIKTEQVFNYRLNAYEIIPFHSKLFKNSELITEIDNGYCLRNIDTDSYMFISSDMILHGKKFIPLDRRHFLEVEVASNDRGVYSVIKIHKITHIIHPYDTSQRLFQGKKHFGKPVLLEGIDLNFNYISYLNANIDLIIDTAYNGIVRSFKYKINPNKSYYKIGVKCDRIVVNLISETGAEFEGQLVIKGYKEG